MMTLTVMIVAALVPLTGCQRQAPARILVECEHDGNTDIFVMQADGSGLVNLTNHPAWDGTPAWSPDGKRIAFTSDREDDKPQIYVMNADGSDVVRLTVSDGLDMMPAWSPDGQKIAFVSARPYTLTLEGGQLMIDAGPEIWVMDADGGNPTRITGGQEDQALYPAWAPDGLRLAYMNISNRIDILVHVLGEELGRSLTADATFGSWSPAWSPDGSRLAFMAEQEDGNKEIYVMDVDGSHVENLTNNPAAEADPSWSPDGKKILFISNRDSHAQVYMMDADGSNVTRITHDNYEYARPVWSPASR
ncbi:MAG: DPP IV N-terminal domain-containing protein [Anaerolineae bacterium]|nr:DPP IV N-terminal domain-containing protein [Anaerolineae bacterium]MDH7475621.1 DPP IV N-terminal domain-containing protein [Anaerolineae bacterium]